MAKFEIMIPFILHCEAGITPETAALPYEQMFATAKKTGFACDPDDPGGATMCGITLATYTAYRTANRHLHTTVNDLKHMKFDEWSTIFRLMFWNRCRADQINCQQIAHAIVDWAWGSGSKGIMAVQKLLHVKADGIIGEKTLAAINGYADQHALFDLIQTARDKYHERIAKINPKLRKYLKGWRNRLNKITWEGLRYVTATPKQRCAR